MNGHSEIRRCILSPVPLPIAILPAYARAVDVADAPDVLFTPSDGYVRYIPPVAGVAWLPEYPAWPGQWALPFGHDYQVPWYAQPYGYGCGHDGYGYC